jgi:hypothetical protein
MTTRRVLRPPRFPLFRGWWIAIAQNVAPRWFHGREHHFPTFALADAPAGAAVTRVVSASIW